MMTQKEIQQRAHELQAVGPDEFPYHFYVHLAREEAREETTEDGDLL